VKPGGISCKEVVELVTAYLDGALEPEEAARVDAHLALCEPCVRFVEQVRLTARAAARIDLDAHPDRDALLAAFRDFSRGTDS